MSYFLSHDNERNKHNYKRLKVNIMTPLCCTVYNTDDVNSNVYLTCLVWRYS